MKVTEILLQHGWGFDSACWQNWRIELSHLSDEANKFIIHAADRGYTGQPSGKFAWSYPHSRKIVVAHSFGLHMLNGEALQEIDVLATIGSFHSFFPADEKSRKIAQRSLTLMARKLSNRPLDVLKDFYDQCGLIPPMAPSLCTASLCIPLLQRDLEELSTSVLNRLPLSARRKIVLHGQNDKIVSVEKAFALSQRFGADCQLLVHDLSGHGLPFTHAHFCLQAILNYSLRPKEGLVEQNK
jgi:pimeloyl-[acyl-carrier protein] methyl ester esterase